MKCPWGSTREGESQEEVNWAAWQNGKARHTRGKDSDYLAKPILQHRDLKTEANMIKRGGRKDA